jgi:phosphate transport system protein
MPTSADGFISRIEQLRSDLVAQGRRVQHVTEAAFEAMFEGSHEKARAVVHQDDAIDSVDVLIEKQAVVLLYDATRGGAELEAHQLRAILTIVKVNNELERAADVAVEIAQRVESSPPRRYPDTFRVMANSVIGILRDANTSVERGDPALANIVLQSQHAVSAFREAVMRDAESQLASGAIAPDVAFMLHEVASDCEIIADHCTNIAEQVIYLTTGAIVRHGQTSWVEVGKSRSA